MVVGAFKIPRLKFFPRRGFCDELGFKMLSVSDGDLVENDTVLLVVLDPFNVDKDDAVGRALLLELLDIPDGVCAGPRSGILGSEMPALSPKLKLRSGGF